ncbi:MAG: hypothetical protein ACK5MW_04410 [Enterococcus sp.]
MKTVLNDGTKETEELKGLVAKLVAQHLGHESHSTELVTGEVDELTISMKMYLKDSQAPVVVNLDATQLFVAEATPKLAV